MKLFGLLKSKSDNARFIKTASALTSGRFFNTGISIVLILIQSKFIGPEVTGVVDAFSVPVGYLWILTFGVSSALARELPYYLAKGERDKAIRMAETAQTFSVFVGGGAALVFLAMSLWALINGDYLSAMGWGFQVIASFFTIYNSFVLTLFRTTDEFVTVAKSHYVTGIATIVTFPLVFLNPYLGLMAKSQFATLAQNFFLYIKRPFKLRLRFEPELIKELIRFGLPLIVIGYIESSLWVTTQRSMINALAGTTLLGNYGFVYRLLTALLIIPNAVNDILRPRFSMTYGATGSIRKTVKVAVKPMTVTVIVSVLAILLSSTLGVVLIQHFLPKYAAAAPALCVSLFLLPLIAVRTVKYIFVVCKNMKFNLLSTAPGYLLTVILQYFFLCHYPGNMLLLFLPYVLGQFLNLTITFTCVYVLIRAEKYKEIAA